MSSLMLQMSPIALVIALILILRRPPVQAALAGVVLVLVLWALGAAGPVSAAISSAIFQDTTILFLSTACVIVPGLAQSVAESLADAMTRAGATPASADVLVPATTLQITSERWGNQPISIDQNGRAQEFSLRYAVQFTLVDAQGATVVPLQVVELARDYTAPPADSIGKTSERELLSKEMRREMSQAILRRVGAALQVTRPEINTRRGEGAAES